jgi:hypothetical protein
MRRADEVWCTEFRSGARAIAWAASVALSVSVVFNTSSAVPQSVQQAQPTSPSEDWAKSGIEDRARASVDDQICLLDAARRLRKATVILGTPGRTRGIGFIVSRKHGLIVTAAHVADRLAEDREMEAVVEGSDTAYRVQRVWYHPRLVRELDDGLSARSDNPSDGGVTYPCADVAILQVSNRGRELPDEYILADDPELRVLDAQPVAARGYSEGSRHAWPPGGLPSRTSFVAGILGLRLICEDDRGGPAPDYVYLAVDFDGAASGSPIFLKNGHVVALVASERRCSATVQQVQGLRVDSLDELVAYHGLRGLLSRDGTPASPRADWGPDPQLEQLRQAVRLVREAERLRVAGKYGEAGRRCNDALAIAPRYGGALIQRSKVYLYFLGNHWHELTHDERSRYARWAFEDSYRALERCLESVDFAMIHLQNLVYLAALDLRADAPEAVLQTVDEFLHRNPLADQLTDNQRSFVLNLRAQVYHLQRRPSLAERDYAESIRLAPNEPRWYLNRAQFWDQEGRGELAIADRLKAENIRRTREPKGANSYIQGVRPGWRQDNPILRLP